MTNLLHQQQTCSERSTDPFPACDRHSRGAQVDLNNLPEDPPCLLREGKVPQSDYRVALRNERCAVSLETKEKPGVLR